MNNIIKCQYCGGIFSAEFFDSHICIPTLKGTAEIPVKYYYESKPLNKEPVIIAKGHDGILYRLVLTKVKSKVKFFNFSSDEFLQGDSSDKDYTEPLVGRYL
jgi:hypothetical protein